MNIPTCIGEAPWCPEPPEILRSPAQQAVSGPAVADMLRRAADHLDPEAADARTLDECAARVAAMELRHRADLLEQDAPRQRDRAEAERLDPPTSAGEIIDAVCELHGFSVSRLLDRDRWSGNGQAIRDELAVMRAEVCGVARAIVPGPPSYPDLNHALNLGGHNTAWMASLRFEARADRDDCINEVVSTIVSMRKAAARRLG